MTEMISFQPKQQPVYIKVIGVGGGGSNAVNHMFKQGIKGVDFLVCNTDLQALDTSPVPVKIALGDRVLGAGSKPDVGRAAANESIDKINESLTEETQMVFITAGMGGGTGTGAAPIIAEAAHKKGILTVAIVTLPFLWEGRRRRQQAEAGIEEIRKHVDTLLVICNDKLREQYGNLSVKEAFAHADNVLSSAARGIAELITVPGDVNIDFEDVKTVIEDSGKAIMGSSTAEGEGRALKAIEDAMSSPLLNDNDIKGARNILLYIMTGTKDITMDEITEITDYVHQESGGDHDADVIWGNGTDENLGDKIAITIIATGFNAKKNVKAPETPKVIGQVGTGKIDTNTTETEEEKQEEKSFEPVKRFSLDDESATDTDHKRLPEIKITHHNDESATGPGSEKKETFDTFRPIEMVKSSEEKPENKIVHTLGVEEETKEEKPVTRNETETYFGKESQSHLSIQRTVYTKPVEKKPTEEVDNGDDPLERNAHFRSNKLREMSMFGRSDMAEKENVPAYIRKQIELDDSVPSTDSNISRYSLGKDSKNNPDIKSNNSFLHDNVD
jgi:cell division protein FtsZ